MSDSPPSNSAEQEPIGVLIVDDHTVFAESLRIALTVSGFRAAAVTDPGTDSLAAAVASWLPDVVLLDIDLGVVNGHDLISAGSALGARVVMLTGVRDHLKLARCLEAGADGIIDKGESLPSIINSVERASRGEPLLAPGVRHELLMSHRAAREAEARRRRLFGQLTNRELEVLASLASGKKVAEIARNSCVSVATVRSQVNSILRKLAVNSQLEAVAVAHAHDWDLGDGFRGPRP